MSETWIWNLLYTVVTENSYVVILESDNLNRLQANTHKIDRLKILINLTSNCSYRELLNLSGL